MIKPRVLLTSRAVNGSEFKYVGICLKHMGELCQKFFFSKWSVYIADVHLLQVDQEHILPKIVHFRFMYSFT